MQLLMDYVGDLDAHIVYLPDPPQDAEIIGLSLRHFQDVLLHDMEPPHAYVTTTVPFQT